MKRRTIGERKRGLEKLTTVAVTMLTAFVMIGVAGMLASNPVQATGWTYTYSPNLWRDLVVTEHGEHVGVDLIRCWTDWSPECQIFMDLQHTDYGRAHDAAHFVAWNRTVSGADYVVMIQDLQTGSMWHHADPNANDFIVYAWMGLMIAIDVPESWTVGGGGGGGGWTYGLEIRLGGLGSGQDYCMVDGNAWYELPFKKAASTEIGMYGSKGWYPSAITAADLRTHLYYDNQTAYVQWYSVDAWDLHNQAWFTYDSRYPATNFYVWEHMVQIFRMQNHANYCWSTQ